MKTGSKNNNKGFSLVELIVVIAILAVMMGMFLLTSGILNVRAGKQCAKQLKHELDSIRIASMGKNSVVLRLYQDSGKIYVDENISGPRLDGSPGVVSAKEIKQIGSSRVKVYIANSSYDQDTDADKNAIDYPGLFEELNDIGVLFEFNRSTGALKDCEGQITGKLYRIDVVGGGRSNPLYIKPLTGKIEEKK